MQIAPHGGTPSIERVRDLGPAAPGIPVRGDPVRGDSDGFATPGELLLIDGGSLGRQPTVHVAGRPAEVVGRTEGGGILARVPAGLPAGPVSLEVSHDGGRAASSLMLRRFALVAQPEPGWLHVLEVGQDGARVAGKPLLLSGARSVRFSWDGRAAYALSGGAGGFPRLAIVDTAAPGGPWLAGNLSLPGKSAIALSAAADAPMAAVVSEVDLSLLDLTVSVRPRRYAPWALPSDAERGRVVAADLSPDGKLLALLLGSGNRLMAIDIERPSEPRV
jgi:hypothetical protein